MPRIASAKQDKLAKVRPLIAILIPKFLNLYNPSQNLSPDESILKFKGRLSFVQYMPKKHQTGYFSTNHLCKGVPFLTTAIRNPVSLQHQWVFQHFNEVRPHCAVLENLLFSMCTVLYCTY